MHTRNALKMLVSGEGQTDMLQKRAFFVAYLMHLPFSSAQNPPAVGVDLP
jgi:hypothetical protein